MKTATKAAARAGEQMEPQVDLLRQMLRIRRFEERCVELYSAMKIRGFLHLYIGEEAVAAGAMAALSPDDEIVSTYREHGHALARGISMNCVMAEMYGRVTGCSRGRGGSMHLFDAAHRFFGGNAIVGGGLPVAVGLALADKVQARTAVTACFFGDGAVAEGEFHESMNLAALWQLPVLFCCENNRYAMGTRIDRAQANIDLASRAASYGMPARIVDGMDVLAVSDAVAAAAAAIRSDGGPRFLELQTYRYRAHSMYDPDRYRTKQEIAAWQERDPIEQLRQALIADGRLDDEAYAALDRAAESEVDAAIDFAESSAQEPVQDLTRYVYADATVTP